MCEGELRRGGRTANQDECGGGGGREVSMRHRAGEACDRADVATPSLDGG